MVGDNEARSEDPRDKECSYGLDVWLVRVDCIQIAPSTQQANGSPDAQTQRPERPVFPVSCRSENRHFVTQIEQSLLKGANEHRDAGDPVQSVWRAQCDLHAAETEPLYLIIHGGTPARGDGGPRLVVYENAASSGHPSASVPVRVDVA